MRLTPQSRGRAYSLVLSLLPALAFAQTPGPPLDFSRPTLVATQLTTDPVFGPRPFNFEDEHYRFVRGSYGTDSRTPALLAYSKRRRAWIHIMKVSTEHARLGHAPDGMVLSVGWDHGRFINVPFVPVAESVDLNSPDRAAYVPARSAYRLDFHSRLNEDVALSSFWLATADLEAAFDGRRTPAMVDPDDPRSAGFRTEADDGLIVGVRVETGEWLRWRIDPAQAGVLVDPVAMRHRGAVDVKEARLALTIGGTTLSDQVVAVGRASRSNNVGGILGTALFDRFLVSLDYDARRLHLIDGDAASDAGEPIAVQWRSGAPVVTARITSADGLVRDARLCIETTESKALVLPSASASRVAALQIGSFRFADLPVFSGSVTAGCDGLIGNGLLRRFRVTFDRRHQQLLLTPGSLFDVPYDYDLTGLAVVANGRAVGVGSVEQGTAADKAGLRAGDLILEIDGTPVAGMELAGLRRSLRLDGRERVLSIDRLGSRHVIRLPLPELK